ncbi:DUF554 domain-containing protein [Spirochaeta lutea]|uniref:DUF554 domain-containing protein n=1 Tax=Spirochaeta lutea TaxID=1480694 RepID=A0A098QUW1_9SPIO|nr:DUF554 domain-containing protein [Spirochaeta lutea]KGE71645.1 hypothetical protein DC28_10270 [Spirochaeta lutea]
MIATVINAIAVILGGLVGLAGGKKLERNTPLQNTVFYGIGVITLIIGLMMALRTQRILYLTLSLVFGGIIGHLIGIEGAILRLGRSIEGLTRRRGSNPRKPGPVPGAPVQAEQTMEDSEARAARFALGFLEASVLFCVGSMTILGSIQAGIEGHYSILLTKSVMDGFMAVLLAAGLGAGVLYSSITILVYQGILTAIASWAGTGVPDLVLSEISGIGGAMIIMIGINLLQLKKVPTANYLPGLVLIVILSLLDPYLPGVFK